MNSIRVAPARAEIWTVSLDPVRGHEQGGVRPGLVVSVVEFNSGPAELVVMLPLTTRDKKIPWHVPIDPPEGGLDKKSYAKVEDIRSVAVERLLQRRGSVSHAVMAQIEDRLRILLRL